MTKEIKTQAMSGWFMLFVTVLLFLSVPVQIGFAIDATRGFQEGGAILNEAGIVLSLIAAIFFCFGFFTLQPNEAMVLVFFGTYCGTVTEAGFYFVNPFKLARREFRLEKGVEARGADGRTITHYSVTKRMKLSLRSRNFESERLKVNDLRGNPIEIAAVVVWKIADTAQAMFDVDNYIHYVRVQSESAVRHLATSYPYDHVEGEEITLRGGGDAIAHALQKELQERLEKAGINVEEARLTHLAYAPEIAQTMLRRQQAEAVIAARQKIVHGAVSMVEMALRDLSEKKVLVLDEDRKAAMVSNLLVVLCGESETKPVINTGTLYQ